MLYDSKNQIPFIYNHPYDTTIKTLYKLPQKSLFPKGLQRYNFLSKCQRTILLIIMQEGNLEFPSSHTTQPR